MPDDHSPAPRPKPADRSLGGRFWAFWSAALAANLSDGVAMIAMPWLASSLTSDPVLVAAVATAGRLPWLLLALPAGVLIDRLPRIPVMAGAGTVRLALWAALAAVVFSGAASVPLLVVFAFCFGALEVCYDTAAETVVASVVPRDRLERANGHLRTGALVVQEFGGRPVGGLLISLGLFAPFVLNAAALVVSVLALLRVRGVDTGGHAGTAGLGDATAAGHAGTAGPAPERRGLRGVGADLAEGVRAIREQPLLRLVAGIALFVNGCYATALSTQVLFVRDVLGLGPVGFGLLMAFAAVGGVVGGQSVARLRAALPHGTLPVACLAATGIVYCVIAALPVLPVVAVGYLLAGGLVLGYAVAMTSIRQRITPDRLLGRVNAAMRTVSWGVSALGMAAGGVMVSALTPLTGHEGALRAPYALIGAVGLAVAVFFGRRLARLVREYDV
ncbi:MFS transporter [Nocardiopsis changdeensis]|uniref:MFS transporter n=1 Tax=Nocardiopsis changdeensis TaxID=2831969 RepID=A0ABX8BJC4_9ACTN|nr:MULTISPECIES: MFS transporter [Nocardiopsis]QUX22352.1 MFS transporter [Nocardiopsis changdeensis]QYX38293.1 MFS transporter [Nocardiopsis sp. MT53]